MTNPVIDIRLTALADAIRARDWDEVEFQYDRVRSTLERELGVRERASDRLRPVPVVEGQPWFSHYDKLAKGTVLVAPDGGHVRIVNPDWPRGDEPYCERVD